MKRLAHALKTFRRECSGIAAVEFALVLPLAVALLFGEFVLGEGLSINRKVAISSRTVADLVARKSTITSSDVSTIMDASTQIAAPYATSGMGVVVTLLTTDASLNTKVAWSKAKNATALTAGQTFALPTGMARANTSLVYTKVTYSYTPPVGQNIFGTLPITNAFYMPPRISASITLN